MLHIVQIRQIARRSRKHQGSKPSYSDILAWRGIDIRQTGGLPS